MNAAARDTVLQHKQKGLPLVVWRDGKVAWIPSDEIDLGTACNLDANHAEAVS